MLSSRCSIPLLHPDPQGKCGSGVQVLLFCRLFLVWYPNKVFLQVQNKQQRDSQRDFLCVRGYFLQLSLFCYSWSECLWETAAVGSPSPPSEAEPPASPQRESFRKSPSPAAALAPCPHGCPLASSLCALSHDGRCQDFCPCSVDDATCFRLVGSDICCPRVAQKVQRVIPSKLKIRSPPPPVSSMGSFSFSATRCTAGGGHHWMCLCHCCHRQIERGRD